MIEERSVIKPESAPLNSAEILRRLAKGRDEEAWAALLQLHGAEILRAARRILGDEALAEDAVQETLLQIRDKAGKFRGKSKSNPHPGIASLARPSPPKGEGTEDSRARNWIMRIACNTSLHILRQRRRANQREQNRPEFASIDAEKVEALAELVRCELAELSESQRVPLSLHFFGGLSYEQLAEELRCSVSAAKVRVHRALKKLRERLAVVGITISAAAIYALLHTSTAFAAETLPDAARFNQWQNLLVSSRQAAINSLSDGTFPLLARFGYVAATAIVCGAAALGTSSSEKQNTLATAGSTAPAKELPKERATEIAAISPEDTDTSETKRLAKSRVSRGDRPPGRQDACGTIGPVAESLRLPVALTTKRTRATAEASPTNALCKNTVTSTQSPLVSNLSQLKMLHRMQQELNARLSRLYEQARVAEHSGLETDSELQRQIDRAADDQYSLARLAQILADQYQAEARKKTVAEKSE